MKKYYYIRFKMTESKNSYKTFRNTLENVYKYIEEAIRPRLAEFDFVEIWEVNGTQPVDSYTK